MTILMRTSDGGENAGVSFAAQFLFIRLKCIKKKYICVCVCVLSGISGMFVFSHHLSTSVYPSVNNDS